MTTDKIKKYVLPYLPYVLVFWFFDKCGEAYRIVTRRDKNTANDRIKMKQKRGKRREKTAATQ